MNPAGARQGWGEALSPPGAKTAELAGAILRAQHPRFPKGRLRVAEFVPSGLKVAGRKLWDDVTEAYDLLPHELRVLASACRTLDELGRLERALAKAKPTVRGSKGQTRPHPLFAEVRAHRTTLKTLLAAVGLPDVDSGYDDGAAGSARSDAGRQLAFIRHHGGRARGAA